MSETTAQERRLRQSDVANAAMLLLQAVERAENTTIPTTIPTEVQTAYGTVELTVDDTGADVVVSRGDRSVHVR